MTRFYRSIGRTGKTFFGASLEFASLLGGVYIINHGNEQGFYLGGLIALAGYLAGNKIVLDSVREGMREEFEEKSKGLEKSLGEKE